MESVGYGLYHFYCLFTWHNRLQVNPSWVVFLQTIRIVNITRGFAPRCVKAESLDPEGSMIGYETKNQRMNKKHIKRKEKKLL